MAEQALTFSRVAKFARPALVSGVPGLVNALEGTLFAVLGFTISVGRIVEINILADRDRLRDVDLTVLDG